MRISPARTCRATGRGSGFTLVELMLVLALMAVIVFLALPSFQNLLQGTLQQEAGRLAGVIRLLRNEAVLTHTNYRLMLDLKRGRYFVQQQDPEGAYHEISDPRVLAGHTLPGDLQLVNLTLLGRTYRTDEIEPLPVVVDPSGYLDPFLLRLTHADEDYTLRVAGFTGRVELVPGHVAR